MYNENIPREEQEIKKLLEMSKRSNFHYQENKLAIYLNSEDKECIINWLCEKAFPIEKSWLLVKEKKMTFIYY